MQQTMKFYAVHDSNLSTLKQVYASPAKALLAFLIKGHRQGSFGQTKDANKQSLSLFQSAKEIVPGKIATALEFLGSREYQLSEYTLSSFQPIPSPTYIGLPMLMPTKSIVRKADGTMDANGTLAVYELLIRTAPVNVNDPSFEHYTLDSFSTANFQNKLVETTRYAINWEVLVLSFVALASIGASFEKMERDLPAIFRTFLTSVVISSSTFQPSPAIMPATISLPGVLLPQSTPSVVQSKLTPMGGQQVQCNIVTGSGPLAQIICGQLSIGPSWKEVIETNRCTIKGYKIAESLIKVAATRIFSIPEQSIMEPLVNSLDAYNPARKIGKFGMGFFSLLYWVVKDQLTALTITSTYREANFVKPCGYRAVIVNQNGELYVDVVETATTPVTATGFKVELNFGLPIDDDTLNRFYEQLDRLKYVTSALIIVNQQEVLNNEAIAIRERNEPGKYQRPKDIVSVLLDRDGFSAEDKATGLSIERFYSTLIVPSISSKTISLSATKEGNFVDRSTVTLKNRADDDSGHNSFRVTIGEIVVVDIKFRTEFLQTVAVLMTLPLHTKVPVSRDDVLLGSVLTEANAAMLRLLQSNIETFSDTSYLEEALLAFANETASSENLDILKTFLDSIPQQLRQRNLVGVPVTETLLYSRLDQGRADFKLGRRYISTLNYDQSWLEEQLRRQEVSSDAFFLNKRVIFVDLRKGILASNGGTASFIFVAESYPFTSKQGERWPASLAVQHKRDILYPVGTKFGENLSKAVLQYTETFRDARSKLLMETLAGKYQAALDLREPQDSSVQNFLSIQIPVIIQYFKTMYYSLYLPEDFHSIAGSIVTILDNLEPTVAAYAERLTIKGVNANSVHDLIRVSQITISRLLSSSVNVPAFKTNLFSGRFDLASFVNANSELHAKASRYQAAFVDRAVRLAIQRQYTHFASVDPFSASYELNIVLELIYATTQSNTARGNDQSILQCFISLLEESNNTFQFILGYLVMHVVFAKLSVVSTGVLKVSNDVKDLLTKLRRISVDAEMVGSQLAGVILSTVTREFGLYPTTRIQTFHRLMVNSGIHSILTYDNLFDAYFQELYRPAVDVYTWMEKTAAVSGLIQEIPRGIPESSETECYRFTLSKLVEFVFQQELPSSNLELFRAVKRFKSKVPARLQIIELAISSGTSKDPIQAKLTELTQNAVDAIRQLNFPEIKIANPVIGIIVKKLAGANELLIGISDPVGIPPAGIVALSIPFLSGKQASEIVTGEIGSGFFNVYREATKVMIITTINGETTEMIDTPIIDPATNQIVDIDRCAVVKRTNAPNGTQIFIQSRHSDVGLTEAAVEAISFTKETLGLVNSDQTITLNNVPVNIPLTMIYATEFFEFRMGTTNFNSYIMTKGVPFAPLHKYLSALGLFKDFTWILDQLKTSVSLNVKSGVFTPVQTRTKIGLTRRNTNLLIRSIIEATFFVILFKIEHRLIDAAELDSYLQYYSSTAIINQVLPSKNHSDVWSSHLNMLTAGKDGLKDVDRDALLLKMSRIPNPFMAMNFSHDRGFTFNSLLVTAAGLFPDIMKIQRFLTGYIETAGHNTETFPGQTIFNFTYRWLVSKKVVPVEMVRVPMPVGPLPPGTKAPPQPKGKTVLVAAPRYLKALLNPNHRVFIEVWIQTYCRLAEQVIPNWPKGVPTILIELKRDSPSVGEYSASANTLTLYYEYMIYPKPKSGATDNLTKIIEIFRTAPDINNAVLTLETNNETWRKFFMPKGTIAHELEHYRSKDEHGKSGHGNVRMDLPYGGLKDRVFLLQHHDTMLSLGGFYAEVSREVRRI